MPYRPATYGAYSGGFIAGSPAAKAFRSRLYPKRPSPTHPYGVGSQSFKSAMASGQIGSDTSGFYPYNDIYGGLLSDLAAQRDQSLAGLRADLEGRSNAVQGIVDKAYAPLESNYNTAINETSAVNEAVANRLAAKGGAAQTDLLNRLSLIQAPGGVVNKSAEDLQSYYGGLGGANYAMDAGDVQRLIGRLSEEKNLLNKQPGLIRQELEQTYGKDVADIMTQYMQESMGLKQSQAESKSQYEKDKFAFGQQQTSDKAQKAKDAEDRYWENYWKQRDDALERYKIAVASGDKKAAAKAKSDMSALDRQKDIDIANIRAGATVESANIHAAASEQNAQTAANKKKDKAAESNVNQQRAYKAALDAIINPKSGQIRLGITPGAGFTAELGMQNAINNVLTSFGINPWGKVGTSIRRAVMAQANNHIFAADTSQKYHYSPKWGKAYKASKKKPKKKKKGK